MKKYIFFLLQSWLNKMKINHIKVYGILLQSDTCFVHIINIKDWLWSKMEWEWKAHPISSPTHLSYNRNWWHIDSLTSFVKIPKLIKVDIVNCEWFSDFSIKYIYKKNQCLVSYKLIHFISLIQNNNKKCLNIT